MKRVVFLEGKRARDGVSLVRKKKMKRTSEMLLERIVEKAEAPVLVINGKVVRNEQQGWYHGLKLVSFRDEFLCFKIRRLYHGL